MSHISALNVKILFPLFRLFAKLNCFKQTHTVFVQGFPRLASPPCWVPGSQSVLLGPHRCTAAALTEPLLSHTHTLINGWVPLPRARGVGASRFIWYIMAARSTVLHWTLSNTCSPIRGCCVGVAWLCHCTDWHCPVGAAQRMKYEAPSDKI